MERATWMIRPPSVAFHTATAFTPAGLRTLTASSVFASVAAPEMSDIDHERWHPTALALGRASAKYPPLATVLATLNERVAASVTPGVRVLTTHMRVGAASVGASVGANVGV